jgi:hypothetical protein
VDIDKKRNEKFKCKKLQKENISTCPAKSLFDIAIYKEEKEKEKRN